MPKKEYNLLKFSGPARYTIIIKGEVSADKALLFDGLDLQVVNKESENTHTILEGELLDQAALAGVLNLIYSLRLPLVDVRYVKNKS